MINDEKQRKAGHLDHLARRQLYERVTENQPPVAEKPLPVMENQPARMRKIARIKCRS